MKKKACFFLLFVISLAVCFSSFALAEAGKSAEERLKAEVSKYSEEHALPLSRLPESLMIIMEEAFEGTALNYVILPESVTTLEKYAFANIPSLYKAILPASVTAIADSAFANDPGLTLEVIPGSYGARWAVRHGFFTVYKDIVVTSESVFVVKRLLENQNARTLLIFGFAALLLLIRVCRANAARRPGEGRTMRPRERAELHSICYRFP